MEWPLFIKIIPIIAALVTIIAGILVIIATKKINDIKIKQAETEEKIASKNLEIIKKEFNNKVILLNETKKLTTEISQRISNNLIDDPTWLDRFMDQTGATYSASVYGNRIGHFYYEKKVIAKNSIDAIEQYLSKDDCNKYCLLIDSGTTMYPVFQEITKRLDKFKGEWQKRICIVTNNIPGIQYLMKYGKMDVTDNYSEIVIDCYMIPGKPLSVYAAITGKISEEWLKGLKVFLKDWGKGAPVQVINFLTGNYMIKNSDNHKIRYSPVARGEGHVEIKNAMVEVSDIIFMLSPLTKFSFANLDLLNKVNEFTINRIDSEDALKSPKKVKYEEILVPPDKQIKFFSTRRVKDNLFYPFGELLYSELVQRYKQDNVIMDHIDVCKWIPNIKENQHLELDREIPHTNLKEKYKPEENIWNIDWVLSTFKVD